MKWKRKWRTGIMGLFLAVGLFVGSTSGETVFAVDVSYGETTVSSKMKTDTEVITPDTGEIKSEVIDDSEEHTHSYEIDIEPATVEEDGSITEYCDECGEENETMIYAVETIKLSKTSYTYNGETQKPSVTVKDRRGYDLQNGTDYTISYPVGMKNVGRYTVKVILKGNYIGTVNRTFTIAPQSVGIKKLIPKSKGLTVKWKKQKAQTTGYEIAFSTNSKFTKKTTGTVVIGTNKTTSRTLSTLKAKKKYYVRIRTYRTVKNNGNSEKIYSAWSKVKSATTKADAAKGIPKLNAKVTTNNILKILNRYDKDGAYVLKDMMDAGDNILAWFSYGDRIIDGIETAVHEETHGYSHRHGSYSFQGQMLSRTTAYFVGNGKTIYLPHTNIYQSKEMASSVPKRLRTFRYNTYVAKPTENLGSNVEGAYGLMNEFMAYRMGMSTTISLYPYYVDKNANWQEWKVFINDCENGRQAYAEFKYYILHYLSYAKQHHPEVYEGIVGNREFCRAYRQLEAGYAKLIDAYEKDLRKIGEFLEEKGCTMEIGEDTLWFDFGGGSKVGTGRFTSDYQKLQKEMEKSEYQAIHKVLVANGK